MSKNYTTNMLIFQSLKKWIYNFGEHYRIYLIPFILPLGILVFLDFVDYLALFETFKVMTLLVIFFYFI